ncbi:3-deoxy-D-arabino-heptulosonate 7-phosphate synthase [Alysiella filiformis]|uniref:3-deoxy-D-arabinoheptulosonate-7-phosphate synthase n=1 Tax=Alysiella filiformis DSM 16848 TaxID=1120981 RepID=A0A286E2G8_9NEIS|nr:3-deoxy-D-arabino-heptulosonate 7-phosphate synthase [Alysiella filiformis]QMT30894.1 3-deoxy-D-arabino-heptulosonate 7-phosphate synthase [Alysiella filiformis]UBQ56120.1 3-deoxy-D-arabino-heptulosonate 7-phosphate synthase [Alysiella filiformis DSM 16848]SOD65082.1 3-deoxy-D-arabinoheptulosonate-7-phosphate synthase [Alysiella filiformis DSM 16848]
MIIVMQNQADESAIERVVATIRQRGLSEHISRGKERTIIGAVGDERVFDVTEFERLPQVERAMKIMHDWRIISREAWAQDTVITVRGVALGGGETQFVASDVSSDLAMILLDPFNAPANPYALSGSLNEKAASKKLQSDIQHLHQNQQIAWVRVRDSSHLEAALSSQADVLYLGGELLANRHILHTVGCLNTPVVVCKSPHHSWRDWLMAAEQIVLHGNQHVILGESGTLSWHGAPLRLDVDAIAAAKQLSHLPVLANISQLAHRQMPHEVLLKLAQAAGADVIVV